jgi:aspartate oxidase
VRSLETDVLVIGGGSAGMCAALAAREAGASVALAYKIGGNCTSVAAGGFAAVLPGVTDDSVENHYENTIQAGLGLADPRLVEILTRQAGAELQKVISWGVEYYTSDDGSLRRFRSGGHNAARTYRCRGGNVVGFFRTLHKRVQTSGIELLKNCALVRLLFSDGRVRGAWGMDDDGQPLKVTAKAVVLATGGYAGAYSNRSAPSGLTGEGLEMAHEVGGTLMDLEFVQFMPTTIAYPPEFHGSIVNDTLRGEGAAIYNSENERFMLRYDPRYGDCAGRASLTIAIATEVAEGRGSPHGGAFLDATALDEKTIFESFGCARRLIAWGIDPRTTRIEITPAAHFTCGGVAIDEHCSTGVPGLYAVGEASAGVHGANRLGANALSETLVFGDIAGGEAARCAQGIVGALGVADPIQKLWLERSLRDGDEGQSAMLDATEGEIKRLFWDNLGVVRSEAPLRSALARLEGLADALDAAGPEAYTYRENVRRERLRKMARLGAKVASAALEREETRGSHYRIDFKATDDALTRHISFRCRTRG